MEPLRRPPHVAQTNANKPQTGPKIPIYPICERIWRDAVRLVTGGEVRQLVPLLAYRNHLSDRQVITILMTTGMAFERVAGTWRVGMFNVSEMAAESGKAVWAEARETAA
jgi:hypothetical protein